MIGPLPLLFLFYLVSAGLAAQGLTVVFTPVVHGQPLNLTTNLGAPIATGAGAVRVEILRFYLTDLVLQQGGKTVFADPVRHHLLDAEYPASFQLPLHPPPGLNYDTVSFTLGVDSTTAAGGVFGGDLDPTKGMYWTWRSGYINFKLEGTAPECPARKQRFQLHVGGFRAPFSAQRRISLPVTVGATLPVRLNLDRLLRAIDLSTDYQIMSPSARSVRLADVIAGCFHTSRHDQE